MATAVTAAAADDSPLSWTFTKVVDDFCQLYSHFMNTLANVFPECEVLAKTKADAVDLADAPFDVKEAKVRAWDADMRRNTNGVTFYKLVVRRDAGLFAHDLQLVRDTNMAPKWADPYFGDDSKAALWQYLDRLNRHARLYCVLPKALWEKAVPLMEKYMTVDETGHYKPVDNLDLTAVMMELKAAFESTTGNKDFELTNMAAVALDILDDMLGPNREKLPGILQSVGLNIPLPVVNTLLDTSINFVAQASTAGSVDASGALQLLNCLQPEMMAQMLAGLSQQPASPAAGLLHKPPQ